MKRSNALILFTSGSSGKPKIIVKSGEVFISNINQTIKAMQFQQKVFLPLLPFTHFYGLSILFIWYLTEGTLTIYNHHHPRNTLYKITSNSVTIVDASPSLYTSLIKYIENKQLDVQNQFDKVKMWCIGGAPLTRGLDDKFKSLFRKPLLNGYGLTEIGNVALANTTNYTGCGQVLPPFQVKIYEESREPLPINEIGEISIYVSFHIKDYNNNILNGDGWYHTGDLGYLDEDNNLFVIKRSKPGVKRMGIMIQPHIIGIRNSGLM